MVHKIYLWVVYNQEEEVKNNGLSYSVFLSMLKAFVLGTSVTNASALKPSPSFPYPIFLFFLIYDFDSFVMTYAPLWMTTNAQKIFSYERHCRIKKVRKRVKDSTQLNAFEKNKTE